MLVECLMLNIHRDWGHNGISTLFGHSGGSTFVEIRLKLNAFCLNYKILHTLFVLLWCHGYLHLSLPQKLHLRVGRVVRTVYFLWMSCLIQTKQTQSSTLLILGWICRAGMYLLGLLENDVSLFLQMEQQSVDCAMEFSCTVFLLLYPMVPGLITVKLLNHTVFLIAYFTR